MGCPVPSSPKNTYISNIILTQVTFRTKSNTYMHKITISKKEAMNLKENWESYIGISRREREGRNDVIRL